MAARTQGMDAMGSARTSALLKLFQTSLDISNARRAEIKAHCFVSGSQSYLFFTFKENGNEEIIYYGVPEDMHFIAPNVNIINARGILEWLKVDWKKVENQL